MTDDCEAVENAIWLIEVAPKLGREGRGFLEHAPGAGASTGSAT